MEIETEQNLSETEQYFLYVCISKRRRKIMYTLREWWMLVNGVEPTEDWDGKLLCLETDAQKTSLTNQTQGFLACYTFTLGN